MTQSHVTQSQAEVAALLPNPPGAIRRWLSAHPLAVDMAILVCYLIGAVPLAAFDAFTLVTDRAFGNFPIIFGYTTLLAIRLGAGVVALIFRRKAPLVGLIILSVALIGDVGALAVANGVALCFLLYAVPVYRDVRTGWIAYAIAVAGSVVSLAFEPLLGEVSLYGSTSVRDVWATAIMSAIWLLVVLLIGINLGNRRRYLAAIIDRAHQLARERDQLAMLAVAEERSRLAREIHDIVAHSVSVMIALSEGGARAVQAAPEEAANAMQRSAETGRTALTEMRRLLGALQADEVAELAPQPSHTDIPSLVRGFAEAGIQVELHESADIEHIERLQGLAMYRVMQEGLTNVLRYAGKGAHAQVRIEDLSDGVAVTVRDFGRAEGTSGPTTGLGSGRGLAGLAERLRVFGGTIDSGPAPDGQGWQLQAFFPNDPQPAPTE
ncbi:sensor histidine kinase [Leucobacter denitrificans]|uniref:histidine kinase n=1 Tax=Leucobacter denitrificans TaxID=683042 RepID=A0A7G9S5B9_9MICO|nr:histidine kinase [Leucobacter denitrificans]QNN63044.1 two-component sensor histidine kinase [Leucobacter denitrificans]